MAEYISEQWAVSDERLSRAMSGDNSECSQLARIETFIDGGLVDVHLRSKVSRIGHVYILGGCAGEGKDWDGLCHQL